MDGMDEYPEDNFCNEEPEDYLEEQFGGHSTDGNNNEQTTEMTPANTRLLMKCMGDPMNCMARLDSTKKKQDKLVIYQEILKYL